MVKKLAVQAQATLKKMSSLNFFFNPLQRTGIVLVYIYIVVALHIVVGVYIK
jgi:hypothetical protein